jgi:hypothetical protein
MHIHTVCIASIYRYQYGELWDIVAALKILFRRFCGIKSFLYLTYRKLRMTARISRKEKRSPPTGRRDRRAYVPSLLPSLATRVRKYETQSRAPRDGCSRAKACPYTVPPRFGLAAACGSVVFSILLFYGAISTAHSVTGPALPKCVEKKR